MLALSALPAVEISAPAPLAAASTALGTGFALLGPPTSAFVAGAESFARWVSAASPGHGCVYARVASLPRGEEVRSRARALGEAGLVALHVRPAASGELATTGGRLFDYVARRTDRPMTSAIRFAQDDERLRDDERLLLDIVSELADLERPCPPNAELAMMSGIRDARRVGAVMARLRAAGSISVEVRAFEPVRVVTIAATGARTRRFK